eukprot:TRINITY_DN6170_c0_g1_i1.p1 TRINITY_DN6170_c0_g1~~TRINITY_DN6170_c0_g1_i1.p1  ORF type:complete len:175 (-),score=19.20 TRINITY_DN6170_c0_g1_i1:393-917(-)
MYPAYASFKALRDGTENDHRQWLTYWIVISAFTTVEYWSDLFLFWLPFYYETKLGFVLWLQAPQTRGALSLYDNYILPTLEHHEQHIDTTLLRARQGLRSKIGELGNTGLRWLRQHLISLSQEMSSLPAASESEGGNGNQGPIIEPVEDDSVDTSAGTSPGIRQRQGHRITDLD